MTEGHITSSWSCVMLEEWACTGRSSFMSNISSVNEQGVGWVISHVHHKSVSLSHHVVDLASVTMVYPRGVLQYSDRVLQSQALGHYSSHTRGVKVSLSGSITIRLPGVITIPSQGVL